MNFRIFDFFEIGSEEVQLSIPQEEPGLEGWFDTAKDFFKPDILFNEETKMIEIRNLNFNQLNKRIQNIYSERNMFTIFNIIYNSRDYEKYQANRIQKSQMRKRYLEFEPFFALEVMMLFETLYKQYGLTYYKRIADWLEKNTWISKTADTHTILNQANLKELDPKFTLKDYQLEFIREYPNLKDKHFLDGYMLSFEQGLGKSLTSIALSLALGCDLVIIVCPNSLKGNWSSEIKSYFTKYQKDESLYHDEVYAVKESYWPCKKNKVKYLIINQESISKIYDYLPVRRNNPMIIVDESHYFRNIDSKRTDELIGLKKHLNCKNNLGMSGSPIKALPNELVPMMMFIDPLFTESVAKKYNKIFNVVGLSTADIVKRRFSRIMYRKTKAEVLKLPPIKYNDIRLTLNNGKTYTVDEVNKVVMEKFTKIMKDEQPKYNNYRKEYLRLLEDAVKSADDRINRNAYAEYLEYLRVFDSGKDVTEVYNEINLERIQGFTKQYVYPTITDKKLRDDLKFNETRYIRLQASCMGRAIGKVLPPARSSMYIDIWNQYRVKFIDAIRNHTKKTVIFTPLLKVAKFIADDLNSNEIDTVLIVGETKERTKEIERFKHDDNVEVLVATVQTLATGVTLSPMSDVMYWFGTPWRSAEYEQGCARIHRIGQTTDVNIYNVYLDTGKTPNLSMRMDKIMKWSGKMFEGFIENVGKEE